MAHPRVQVEHARNFLGVDHLKVHYIVQPVVAAAVPVLYRDSQRIFAAAQQTIKFELDFQSVARFEIAENALLNTVFVPNTSTPIRFRIRMPTTGLLLGR